MSEIPEIDIGSRYSYMAAVFYEFLEETLKTGKIPEEEFPAGIMDSAVEFFKITQAYFGFLNRGKIVSGKNKMMGPAVYELAKDCLRAAGNSGLENNVSSEKEIKKMSRLTESFQTPGSEIKKLDEFRELKDFYEAMGRISETAHYDKVMSGRNSKYTLS